MKNSAFIFLFFFLSCTKTDKSAIESAEFKDLVGTWKTDYPNDEVRKIIIHKNGKVEIIKSTERRNKFQITEFNYDKSSLVHKGDTLYEYSLGSIINGKVHGSLFIYKNPFADSSFISLGLYIKKFEVDTNLTILNKLYLKN